MLVANSGKFWMLNKPAYFLWFVSSRWSDWIDTFYNGTHILWHKSRVSTTCNSGMISPLPISNLRASGKDIYSSHFDEETWLSINLWNSFSYGPFAKQGDMGKVPQLSRRSWQHPSQLERTRPISKIFETKPKSL